MKLIKVFLLCFGFLTQAQNSFEIKGRVLSEKEGLPYVSVYIQGTSVGTTTDDNGYFVLANVEAGIQEITASFVGYKTVKKSVTISA